MVDIGGPFCKVEFTPTNINSHTQVKAFLLTQGWVPTSYTELGSPQLTEDSYTSIQGDVGKMLAKRAVLKHRLGLLFSINKEHELKGWINQLRPDGRLEAGGIPQGTNTGRYRHTGVVNVPKAKDSILYGKDLRSLFIAAPGYWLVGTDADALEARIEAHYCYTMPGGKEHAEALLNGDIHQRTADKLGIDRDTAKTVKYASSYGARPKKLSETLDCSLKEAKAIYDGFWEANPALAGLYKAAERAYKARGFLVGMDGRKLLIREPHKLVNTLIQSGGSIVVKTATVYVANWVRMEGLDARQVMHFHDEYTYEARDGQEDRVAMLSGKSFEAAGEYWKLHVPITGSPKIGKTWCEIH